MTGMGAGWQAGSPVRLLFLDRDGTLNRTVERRPPNTPEEVELLPNVVPVLSRHVAAGWQLVIVSNQGGVASGYITESQAHAVQRRVIELLSVPVAASYLCPHMPNAVIPAYALDCPNRKPEPGFILDALERFGARAAECLFVGDTVTDRQAAEAAGVPFRWADRFFQRPVDRGLKTRDGRWVRLRELAVENAGVVQDLIQQAGGHGAAQVLQRLGEPAPNEEGKGTPEAQGAGPDLYLLARVEDTAAGWLALARGRTPGEARTADLGLGVDESYHGAGIDALLMETGLEWARQQQGLKRVCVQVPAEDAPVTTLCCALGFVEEGRQPRGREGTALDRVTMACYL
jgi:D-glycero-D-manno-heptose 1,7-bisphosphate phosphatase